MGGFSSFRFFLLTCFMLVSQLEFIRQIRPHGADTPVGDATPTDTEGGKMTNKNLRGEQKKKRRTKKKRKEINIEFNI